MEFIRDFKEISKEDVLAAGGKGASLGEMTNSHLPIPPGFVVLSSAFDHFIKETDLVTEIDTQLHKVDTDKMHTVEEASAKIQRLIKEAEFPRDIESEIKKQFKLLDAEFVAVRSSATSEDGSSAAWAGQLESYLNVKDANIIDKVQHCFASLFTPRAIFYRFEKGFHKEKISVAVVVQKMIQSEESGIAFSVHPVTQDHNQLIIEAGFGLGEAIVSGAITPDSYVVEKEPRRIIDKNVIFQGRGIFRGDKEGTQWQDIEKEKGEQQVLSDEKILELSDLIIAIENHYGFPCDIEWACEDGNFYITQSRPITTLSNEKKETTSSKYNMAYYKEMSRDAALVLFDVWYEGEKKQFINWFREEPPSNPYMIFDNNQGLTDVYYDPAGVKWVEDKAVELVSKDNNFIRQSIDKYYEIVTPLKEKWEESPYLSAEEIVDYLDDLRRAWTGLEIAYRFPYIGEERVDKDDIEYAKKARFETEELFDKSDKMIRKSLAKLYPQLNKYSAYLTVGEIKSGELPSLDVLKKRWDHYIWSNYDLHEGVTLGQFAKANGIKLENVEVPIDAEELNGSTANSGIVSGTVRVVRTKDLIDTVQEGEILVAPMTTPDYLPAMKKAAAFVTDEGGVTCHAAIVAREMAKPCIIATKVATKVLKDGDNVEVDADNGVVRIL